jgi:hypothetical protein
VTSLSGVEYKDYKAWKMLLNLFSFMSSEANEKQFSYLMEPLNFLLANSRGVNFSVPAS